MTREFSQAKSLQGRVAGQRRQRMGQQAEKIAENMHEVCYIKGVARVVKVESSLKSTNAGFVHTRKSTVDCLGVLSGGRAVAVEIKSCANNIFRFAGTSASLKPHQHLELALFEKFGGLSVVLCVVSPYEAYAFLYREIRLFMALGYQSVKLNDPRIVNPRIKVLPSGDPYLWRANLRDTEQRDHNTCWVNSVPSKVRSLGPIPTRKRTKKALLLACFGPTTLALPLRITTQKNLARTHQPLRLKTPYGHQTTNTTQTRY